MDKVQKTTGSQLCVNGWTDLMRAAPDSSPKFAIAKKKLPAVRFKLPKAISENEYLDIYFLHNSEH
jgi:hypothetical protein